MGSPITGRTKLCGVIGDPIEHTLSPAMHNAAFAELGLDYIYVPFHVKAPDLSKAVDGIRALNMRGFNVTIPHKVAVMPRLDALDPLAEKIGAVNTVVNDGGKLTGYNTDAEGFVKALREGGVEPGGKNIAILGTGGASRAVSYILAENGASLTILNRREELDWAEALARRITEDFCKNVEVLELSEGIAKALEGAEVLVNTTSVGMSPVSGETPVPAELLRPGLAVFDIVYNPVQTRLLREAEAAGARTISGIEMLAWQGALAFEKWTGQAAPLELMRREALRGLERA